MDVSLYETALGFMAYHLTGYLGAGAVASGRGTEFPSIAPYQAFPAKDGRLMVAAANDRLFAALVEAVGLPELASDPRFATNSDRVANRGELTPLLEARFATEDRATLDRAARRGGRPGRARPGRVRSGRGRADRGARHPPGAAPSVRAGPAHPGVPRLARRRAGRPPLGAARARRAHPRGARRGRLLRRRRSTSSSAAAPSANDARSWRGTRRSSCGCRRAAWSTSSRSGSSSSRRRPSGSRGCGST